MRPIGCLASLLPAGALLAAVSGFAAPEAAAPVALTNAPAAAAEASIEQSENLRNPFWPVGYTPRRAATPPPGAIVPNLAPPPVEDQGPPPEEGWNEAMKELVTRGVTRLGDGRAAAVVNDQVVAEGDMVEARYRGWIYAWRVRGVDLDGVDLSRAPELLRRAPGAAPPEPAVPEKSTPSRLNDGTGDSNAGAGGRT